MPRKMNRQASHLIPQGAFVGFPWWPARYPASYNRISDLTLACKGASSIREWIFSVSFSTGPTTNLTLRKFWKHKTDRRSDELSTSWTRQSYGGEFLSSFSLVSLGDHVAWASGGHSSRCLSASQFHEGFPHTCSSKFPVKLHPSLLSSWVLSWSFHYLRGP